MKSRKGVKKGKKVMVCNRKGKEKLRGRGRRGRDCWELERRCNEGMRGRNGCRGKGE